MFCQCLCCLRTLLAELLRTYRCGSRKTLLISLERAAGDRQTAFALGISHVEHACDAQTVVIWCVIAFCVISGDTSAGCATTGITEVLAAGVPAIAAAAEFAGAEVLIASLVPPAGHLVTGVRSCFLLIYWHCSSGYVLLVIVLLFQFM
jgi:hypothetical protein